MAADLIVSYDGTSNDDDAIALAKLLGAAGATLALAYVRHAHEFDPRREELAQHDAERRLEQGAQLLGAPDTPRHIVVSASTGEGLERLAAEEDASVIVFGSDYRTTPGHAEPGNTAQHLLEGGPIAIAVAAAGLRSRADNGIGTVAVFAPEGDSAAQATADDLAGKLGASVISSDVPAGDLIVVGSQTSGPEGRISLSGTSRSMLNSAQGSVLVVPHGAPVQL